MILKIIINKLKILIMYSEIENFYGNKPIKRKVKNFIKVQDFLESKKFQMFCDLEEDNLQRYPVMQITVCSENEVYEVGNFDEIEDFRINILPEEGARLYKAVRFINRPTVSDEKAIYYAMSYYVHKEEEKWSAELILDDESWLDRKKVTAAFNMLAKKNDYANLGNTEMKEICLHLNGRVPFSTKAWVKRVSLPKNMDRYLLCLMDNGRVLDLPVEMVGIEKIDIPSSGYLRTKFNWFQYLGEGIFSRVK